MYVAARLFINISFGAFESASKVGEIMLDYVG